MRRGHDSEGVQVRIQRVILWALAARGFFSRYVFHGGSCLYFFYENVRWSEDLDFVKHRGNPDHPTKDLAAIEEALREAVRLIPVFIEEVESAEVKCQKRTGDVLRFIVKVSVRGERRKTRVNVEIADVAAYRIMVKPFEQALIAVEDPLEILADKMVALAARAHSWGEPKVRDVLDLYFLGEGRGLLRPETLSETLDILVELIVRKLRDYRLSASEFQKGTEHLKRWLDRPETLEDLRVTFMRYALPSHRAGELAMYVYCEQTLRFAKKALSGGGLFEILLERMRTMEAESSKHSRKVSFSPGSAPVPGS
ncbi:nucleotidyl transferase AbiEii/AbiGii toxin family protein [Thermosulfurimonas sp. F29]|uniref:nucleotidyl transferase AbiEii/AbiGii toxin family protein n=1 Tax=Thermosulfurimonas sp. F29 TaxID=2867247 RepID=UPI001C839E68|nr:nucleotidyl transferase AbiEii/AbiGii toxin family protein [Thermosulfurimonas sp. F29]MBX6424167.1 nucleotidyl transferase AbiEii/AbiGii toxin family protein [Thermosulfurimonas sp. F29]